MINTIKNKKFDGIHFQDVRLWNAARSQIEEYILFSFLFVLCFDLTNF